MEQIAPARARSPKPFMLARQARPVRCGRANKTDGGEKRRRPRRIQGRRRRKVKRAAAAISSRRSSAELVDRPPGGAGWVHEVKFDGYRIQLRIEGGEAHAEDPQGARLDAQIRRHRQGRRGACPTASSTARSWRWTSTARPISLLSRRRLSEGKTEDLIFFAFDLLFDDGEDLRELPLGERKARLQTLLEKLKAEHQPLRYVEHFETGGDAVLESACQHVPGRHRLQAARRTLPVGPQRQLDQGQMPRRP